MYKYLFVGHFSAEEYQKSIANSSAGNQVQIHILDEIINLTNSQDAFCLSMQPIPIWPKGEFVFRSKNKSYIRFPGFVNLPIIKNLFFSFHLLIFLFKNRPKYCIQYNSYLLENLSFIIYRFLFRESIISAIIQDVNCDATIHFFNLFKLKNVIERLGLYVLKYFDFLVPVSDALAKDFNFAKEKYYVFLGGLTSYSVKLLNANDQILDSDTV